jgi:methionyl-tRNA formyltransferase
MRTAFMGTPDFAVASLDALAERTEVVAVVCQPDKPAGRGMKLRPPPVKRRAEELGLPVLQPRRARARSFREEFRALAPELVVVAAYGKILPGDLLEEVPRGFVNVHASLLPRLRGAAPIHAAVLRGEEASGVSIMRLTEGMDEGPVYLDRRVELAPDETAGSLHDRLAIEGAEALGEFLDRVLAGEELAPAEQDHDAATYAHKLDPAEFEVDWSLPAIEVERRIRGLSPFPGSYTFQEGGKRLGLLMAGPAEGGGEPGTIVALGKRGPVVACGEGAVEVTRVKPAGKRTMDAGDWLRGARLEEGARLGPRQEGVS